MNIGHLLTKSALSYPESAAVVFQDKHFTYREFDERVNQLGNAMKQLGIKKGHNIAILQTNSNQMLESMFSCFKIGATAIPINAQLHPQEYGYIIKDSGAVAIIFGQNYREHLTNMRSELVDIQHMICTGEPEDGMLNYEELLSGSSTENSEVEVDPTDNAWIFYTSGTTGKPKGAMLTHRNLLAMTMNYYGDMIGLSPDDAILHAAPLSHGSGLYSIPNVGKAANHVIMPRFRPEEAFQLIEKYRVTNIFLAPTMIKAMLTSDALSKYDLSSLRAITYGGAPMYAEDIKDALRKIGPVFVQLYGLGESPMTITYLRKEEHRLEGTEEEMKRLTSAGIARTCMEVRIVDEEDRELAPGEVGEIVCRGEAVMKGYLNQPEETAETLRNGWLHTGDIGTMDEKGYVYILDRSKDMVISGGVNIYPREVEDVILLHPAVHEVAVIGVPDEYWGEAVKAVVTLKPGKTLTQDELLDFCKEHLASFKKPKTVDFVDAIPKNPYGKVLKRELRDQYLTDKDRRV